MDTSPFTTTLDHYTDRSEAIGPFKFDRKKYILSMDNINIENKEDTDSYYQNSLRFNDNNIQTQETSLKRCDTDVHHTISHPPYEQRYIPTPNRIQLEPWSLYSTFIEEHIKKSIAKFREPSLSLFIGGAYDHEFPRDTFYSRYPQQLVEQDAVRDDPWEFQTQNAVASPTVTKLPIHGHTFWQNQKYDMSRQQGVYRQEFPHGSFDRRSYPQHLVGKDVVLETDPTRMQMQNAVASPTVGLAMLSIDSTSTNFSHNHEDYICRRRFIVPLSFTADETVHENTISSVDTDNVSSVDTVHGPDYISAERRARKTVLDRKYAARLKKQIEMIQKKSPGQRNQEDTILLTQFEERRKKKNQREKERLVQNQSEMNRILAIPELDRSPEDIKSLETLLNAKNRKKELDRMRRSQIRRQNQFEMNRILAIPEQDRSLEENEYLQTLLNAKKRKKELDRMRR